MATCMILPQLWVCLSSLTHRPMLVLTSSFGNRNRPVKVSHFVHSRLAGFLVAGSRVPCPATTIHLSRSHVGSRCGLPESPDRSSFCPPLLTLLKGLIRFVAASPASYLTVARRFPSSGHVLLPPPSISLGLTLPCWPNCRSLQIGVRTP